MIWGTLLKLIIQFYLIYLIIPVLNVFIRSFSFNISNFIKITYLCLLSLSFSVGCRNFYGHNNNLFMKCASQRIVDWKLSF